MEGAVKLWSWWRDPVSALGPTSPFFPRFSWFLRISFLSSSCARLLTYPMKISCLSLLNSLEMASWYTFSFCSTAISCLLRLPSSEFECFRSFSSKTSLEAPSTASSRAKTGCIQFWLSSSWSHTVRATVTSSVDNRLSMLIIQSEAITQDARNHASRIVLISRAKKKSSRVQKDFFFAYKKRILRKKSRFLQRKHGSMAFAAFRGTTKNRKDCCVMNTCCCAASDIDVPSKGVGNRRV